MQPTSLQRRVSTVLAFFLPPLIVGGLVAVSTIKTVMRYKTPAPVMLTGRAVPGQPAPTPRPAPLPPPGGYTPTAAVKPKAERALPTVLFALNPTGSGTLAVLAAWEILAQSQGFTLITAAPRRTLIPLTGGVGLLPDYSFADAPQADYLWVAPGVNPEDPELVAFVKARAESAKEILAPGEAAQTLAASGLLRGQKATSSFLMLPGLRSKYPETEWTSEARWIGSGTVSTSGGAAGAMDLAIAFAERQKILPPALAELAGFGESSPPRVERLERSELARLILELGYGWGRTYYSVAVETGVSELALAAWLEVVARGMSTRVSAVASGKGYIRTQHGLVLVAAETVQESPPPHFLVYPRNLAISAVTEMQAPGLFKRPKHLSFAPWEEQLQVPSLHLESESALEQFRRAFAHIRDEGRLQSMTSTVARLMEWPEKVEAPTPSADWRTWGYVLRFLVLGALGVWTFGKVMKIVTEKRGGGSARQSIDGPASENPSRSV